MRGVRGDGEARGGGDVTRYGVRGDGRGKRVQGSRNVTGRRVHWKRGPQRF